MFTVNTQLRCYHFFVNNFSIEDFKKFNLVLNELQNICHLILHSSRNFKITMREIPSRIMLLFGNVKRDILRHYFMLVPRFSTEWKPGEFLGHFPKSHFWGKNTFFFPSCSFICVVYRSNGVIVKLIGIKKKVQNFAHLSIYYGQIFKRNMYGPNRLGL